MAQQVVTFDDREFVDLRTKLFNLASRGVPHAVRESLNAAAFAARQEYRDEIERSVILRNKWTMRNVFVDRARGSNVRSMEARVGTPLPYMALQEEGGTVSKHGRHGKPIPTRVASGEGMGGREPRRKVVRRPNRLSAIQLGTRVRGPRKQRNAAAVSQAVRAGRKYVLLEMEKRKGIFRIVGGRRRPRIEMVWDLTKPSVQVPANPMMKRALSGASSRFRAIYSDAVEKQVAFHLAKQVSSTFALIIGPQGVMANPSFVRRT